MLKGSKFQCSKALMVALSFAGIEVITIADTPSAEETSKGSMTGNLFSLGSAASYALQSTVLKLYVPPEKEETFDTSNFLCFVGVFNVILVAPFFYIFDQMKIETFEMPNKEVLIGLTLNAIASSVIADYCWAKSTVLNGPLVTSLGLALTIPISMIIDAIY